MTKLEEKLIMLGYENCGENPYIYKCKWFKKFFKYGTEIRITMSENKKGIANYVVHTDSYSFTRQNYIDNLQLAYNQLQKDLEELRNVK